MPDSPNILLIITDHHAWYNHFREGEFTIPLPAWKGFLGQGVKFERAYTVCPLCTPARCSMMSGLYPSQHGLRWNTEAGYGGNLHDFRDDQRLYSHYLEEAGYRNAYVGKWHCGHEKLPEDYGMEGWSLPDYGKPYMSEKYAEYCRARGLGPARARIEANLNRAEEAGQTVTLHHRSPWHFMNASGVLEGPPAGHQEQFTAHLAAEKLKELAAGDRPWSLTASFWGPHQPYYPSEPYAGRIDPASIPEYPSFDDDLKGRPFRHWVHRDQVHTGPRRQWKEWSDWQPVLARAYEQQMQLDDAIGSVLGALEGSGQADNTLVLWVSDHGDALASHGGIWDKSSTYTEEVGRVLCAARWPTGFEGGRLTEALVSNMDVTATMLDAAGVSIPDEMASRSLLSLCREPEKPEWPDEIICEHNGHGPEILQRILITDRYKYVGALHDGDEMYDLHSDPHEMNNLVTVPEYRDMAAELRERLIRHIDNTGDRIAGGYLRHWLEEGFGAR